MLAFSAEAERVGVEPFVEPMERSDVASRLADAGFVVAVVAAVRQAVHLAGFLSRRFNRGVVLDTREESVVVIVDSSLPRGTFVIVDESGARSVVEADEDVINLLATLLRPSP